MNHGSADLQRCFSETCGPCPWTRLPAVCQCALSNHCIALVTSQPSFLPQSLEISDPDVSSLGCLSFSAYTIVHLFQLFSIMALASLPLVLILCRASWILWLVDLKSDLLIDDSKGKISLLLRKPAK